VGSGKTATAQAVGDELRRRGEPNAVIDLDQLRRRWPAPDDDPFDSALELANLAAVAGVYRRAGAATLVLAGVVEGPEARRRYAEVVGEPLVVVRLRVDLDLVRRRLAQRHGPGEALDWHLARSGELDAILDREDAADLAVDVGDDPVETVARRVLVSAGWV